MNLNVNSNYFNRGAWDNWSGGWATNNHWNNFNYQPWHNSWYHGCWNANYGNTAAAFGIGAAVGTAGSWLWGPSIYQSGYYSYANPYVSEPTVIQVDSGPQVVVDYTQPIPSEPIVINNPVPVQGEPVYIDNTQPPAVAEPDPTGLEVYGEARQLFYDGDYSAALAKSNLALSKLPTDATLHQFRALCLFAQQDYRNAAAAINSVLSIGPGWDWTTLSSLYASSDTYTAQLRALEAFVGQNQDAAYGHFLLAYHYITCGYNDDAVAELKRTVELEPSDRVATNLLGILEPPETVMAAKPEVDTNPAPAFEAGQLFGSWKSTTNPAASIDLQLQEDGNFSWVVSQNGQATTTLAGEFSMADNNLMLQPQDGGPLVGVVTLQNDNSFNFKLVGSPPGDKGLDFQKQ